MANIKLPFLNTNMYLQSSVCLLSVETYGRVICETLAYPSESIELSRPYTC